MSRRFPGADLRYDLTRTTATVLRTGSAAPAEFDVGTFLANWKNYSRASGNYRTYPYQVGDNQMQQIVPQNLLRTALILVAFGPLALNRGFFLLDEGPLDLSPLNPVFLARAIPVLGDSPQIFPVAPTNPVTVLSPPGNGSITGVIIVAADS
jgi:hypothetical protein